MPDLRGRRVGEVDRRVVKPLDDGPLSGGAAAASNGFLGTSAQSRSSRTSSEVLKNSTAASSIARFSAPFPPPVRSYWTLGVATV